MDTTYYDARFDEWINALSWRLETIYTRARRRYHAERFSMQKPYFMLEMEPRSVQTKPNEELKCVSSKVFGFSKLICVKKLNVHDIANREWNKQHILGEDDLSWSFVKVNYNGYNESIEMSSTNTYFGFEC